MAASANRVIELAVYEYAYGTRVTRPQGAASATSAGPTRLWTGISRAAAPGYCSGKHCVVQALEVLVAFVKA